MSMVMDIEKQIRTPMMPNIEHTCILFFYAGGIYVHLSMTIRCLNRIWKMVRVLELY